MRVLVTGGAGTIGTALRRVGDSDVTWACLSRCEHRQQPLMAAGVRCYTADVADRRAVRRAARLFHPQVVVHAAAVKHVSTAERDPSVAMRTNVHGTRNMLEAASEVGARFVLISTDKACEPTTTYGATKLLAERLVYEHHATGASAFVARYGNVFASNGSFSLHILRRWEATRDAGGRGEHFALTSPAATRFWWSPDDAARFIWDALSHHYRTLPPPRLYVPRLRSASMRRVITTLMPEASYEVTGLTSGEKTHEVLLTGQDWARAGRDTLAGREYYYSDGHLKRAGAPTLDSLCGPRMADHEIVELAEKTLAELGGHDMVGVR